MTNLDRKTTILLHIQKYCIEIEENFKFFGTHLEVFKENNIFRDSISMKVFQIGELTKELDKNYKSFIKETEKSILEELKLNMKVLQLTYMIKNVC